MHVQLDLDVLVFKVMAIGYYLIACIKNYNFFSKLPIPYYKSHCYHVLENIFKKKPGVIFKPRDASYNLFINAPIAGISLIG